MWGDLSPYYLTNENGHVFENIWQFSKVYKTVPQSTQRYSRFDQKVIWEHDKEVHVKNDSVTKKYLKWRVKGMQNEYAVRYPVGFSNRHNCLYAYGGGLVPDTSVKMDYIESRKQIYLPEYCNLVRNEPRFKKLLKMLENGKNLLIVEVDGPHQESLEYYKEKYNVDDSFIVNDTVLVTKENINILLNDPKHPFGHGYCLGVALCGISTK